MADREPSATPDRELSSSPSMALLFARASAALIPGASRLPFVAGGGGEVWPAAVTLEGVTVDRSQLAAYDRVCDFDLSDTLPVTYIHMLAFPLQLALMTDGRFPLPAIGLVHIANRIVAHRPVQAVERLSLRVWAEPLEPHPRGVTCTLRTEARAGDELVWEESSTNLRRGAGASDAVPVPVPAHEPPPAAGLPAIATWRLPGNLGRRYGAVSGDLNPIHVHPLSARLFGFPRAIAHGMWTQARCLAALGPRLPGAYTVQVAFRRPILLPATVVFAASPGDGAIAFGVRDARRETAHLDGIAEL